MSFREPLLTVDVIVVGYGAAEASAALTAHEHGAETIILETFVEGLLENPPWLESLGGELEVYNFKQDPTLSYYIPNLTFPGLPSAKGLELAALHLKQTETCPEPTGGHRLWNLLDRHVKSRGIKVMVSTPVQELVKNSRGEIIGVVARSLL